MYIVKKFTRYAMKLFKDLKLKFEQANWSKDPELSLIDTILEQNPQVLSILEFDITKGPSISIFGRRDMPSVEQIIRAAIYK